MAVDRRVYIPSGFEHQQNYGARGPFPWIIEHNDKSIIWFENPRVASSTIKYLIGKRKDKHNRSHSESDRFKVTLLKKRGPGDVELFDKINNTLNLSNMFKFGICRNPYSRLISCFRMILEEPTKGGLTRTYSRKERYKDKVLDLGDLSFEEFVHKVVRRYWVNHHWKPQYKFFPENISTNHGGLSIIKMETLDEGIHLFFDKLGINYEKLKFIKSPGSKPNFTAGKGTKNVYDNSIYLESEEIREMIWKFYKNDFLIFGYEKEDYDI